MGMANSAVTVTSQASVMVASMCPSPLMRQDW